MGAPSGPRPSPRCERGFTLLEILIVLVIAAIAASMVSLAFRNNDSLRLHDEGARLAELFDLAQNEAQLRGHALAWQANLIGYQFTEKVDGRWQPLDDNLFRSRRWQTPLDGVTIDIPGSSTALLSVQFGVESIAQPLRIRLFRADDEVDVYASARGHFEVR